MKVAPVPGPLLDPETVPPCSSTSSLDDREAEPEPAVLARKAAIRLPESLEEVREKRRFDPAARRRARQSGPGELTRSRRSCTCPPRGVNFTAFDSRFHTTCWSRSGSPDTGATVGLDERFDGDALGVRRPAARVATAFFEDLAGARPAARSAAACRR